MTTARIQSVSFVLFLLALPLASFGAVQGEVVVWGAALVLFVVAGILPPATRFLDLGGDDDAADDDAADDDAEDESDGDAAGDDRPDARTQVAPTPVRVQAHPGAADPPPRRAPNTPGAPRAREQRRRAERTGPDRPSGVA